MYGKSVEVSTPMGSSNHSRKIGGPARRQAPHTPCFTAGTEIATARGPVPIEDLRVGDRVLTRDNGYRPIRWIGARRFDAAALAEFPDLQPVRIRKGALGNGLPERDLTVSPQHRMLLIGAGAEALADETEILVAATDLVEMGIAEPAHHIEVVYYHLMFDAHEIVWGNGCWSESFLPEAVALEGLHSAQRREILMIFPELATPGGQLAYGPARVAFVPAARPAVAIAA